MTTAYALINAGKLIQEADELYTKMQQAVSRDELSYSRFGVTVQMAIETYEQALVELSRGDAPYSVVDEVNNKLAECRNWQSEMEKQVTPTQTTSELMGL